jgi:hypothetical protein
LSLLIMPIGLPVAFFVFSWVVAGFQKSGIKPDQQSTRKLNDQTQPAGSTACQLPHDYYPIISRAVQKLAPNNPETRQEFERAQRVFDRELFRTEAAAGNPSL